MNGTEDIGGAAERALLLALGQEIRAWRNRRGLSREELAEQADVSTSTLGRMEREGPVDVAATFRLAMALGVSPADLVRRAEEALAVDRSAPSERQTLDNLTDYFHESAASKDESSGESGVSA